MSGMDEKSADTLLQEYSEEPAAGTLRDVAPKAFAALEAVLKVHRETAEQDAARGHWSAPWDEGGRWMRDRPAWCPVCDVTRPCPTEQVIAEKL